MSAASLLNARKKTEEKKTIHLGGWSAVDPHFALLHQALAFLLHVQLTPKFEEPKCTLSHLAVVLTGALCTNPGMAQYLCTK